MLRLAITTVRFRAVSFIAAFASMLLGAVIVMTFASLVDVSKAPALSAAETENLLTMAAVVGAGGLVIVLFAVVTTMTLVVRQRSSEIGLLKSVGATPAQVRRLISSEAGILALIAALVAVPISVLAGRGLLRMLKSAGLLNPDVAPRFGLTAVVVGFGVTIIASVAAAWVTSRRTAGLGIAEALLQARSEPPGLPRSRAIAGWVFIAGGGSAAMVSVLVLKDADISILQIVAGEASLLTAVGLALLAPALVVSLTGRLMGTLRPKLGVGGYLGSLNVQRRPHQMSGALAPIILLTAVTVATLYTQRIDNSIAARGGPTSVDADGVQVLNYTVVAMLCLLAAIMLVNSLIAATAYRRAEFGAYRLLGLTASGIYRIVAAEKVAIIATGIIGGTFAGALTVIPYSIARTGSVVPDAGPGIFLAMLALVALLTLGSSLVTAQRVMRPSALEAGMA